MSAFSVPSFFGAIGRAGNEFFTQPRKGLVHVGNIWRMLLSSLYFATIGPLLGKSKLRRQLAPTLRNVGVRSFPIVALVNLLTGAIMVLQLGDVMERYGQIQEMPGAVALSMTRELGPLMTAVVMTARVGASFTAVLASMKINDEIMALETMAINPIGYLVSPRVLSMLVMVPCLTVLSYLIGMFGGAVIAYISYDISFSFYTTKTAEYLTMADLGAGLLKASAFSILISIVCCYFGFIAEGGPTGLGRYTMVAVVTSIVVVVVADAVLTGFTVNYML